jgi:hypothetical protein
MMPMPILRFDAGNRPSDSTGGGVTNCGSSRSVCFVFDPAIIAKSLP